MEPVRCDLCFVEDQLGFNMATEGRRLKANLGPIIFVHRASVVQPKSRMLVATSRRAGISRIGRMRAETASRSHQLVSGRDVLRIDLFRLMGGGLAYVGGY